MNMTRGLHPETKPQRQGAPGRWVVPPPGAEHVERRDAPMRSVGKGIGWIVFALVVIVAGVLIFTSAIKPRTPLTAHSAAARFSAPPPRLQVAGPPERVALEKAHAGPGEAAITSAMDRVVQDGWADAAPPPSRNDVAMHRAQAVP